MNAPVRPLIELIRLRRLSADFGYVSVRLREVMLNGIAVKVERNGGLRITPPSTVSKDGTEWPCFNLQPTSRFIVHPQCQSPGSLTTLSY
jgi:hypothetical protein